MKTEHPLEIGRPPQWLFVDTERCHQWENGEFRMGDIANAVSCERIASGKEVKPPVDIGGRLYVVVGSRGHREISYDAYSIIPEEEYPYEVCDYKDHPYYGYEGIRVRWKKKAYVLTGAVVIKPAEQYEQLPLYGVGA